MRYIKFQAPEERPTGYDCTTPWPETVSCSIKRTGLISGRFTNLQEMDGEGLGGWLEENTGKVKEIMLEEFNNILFDGQHSSIYTKFEFNQKFTFEELVAITIASKTDPEIEVVKHSFDIAEDINVRDTALVMGMQLLVLKGLLTEARMNEILSQ